MTNTVGIRRYDYIEFYVGSAKMVAYWFSKAMGLKITAYSGPETGCRDRASYLLEKDQIKFVVSSPYNLRLLICNYFFRHMAMV